MTRRAALSLGLCAVSIAAKPSRRYFHTAKKAGRHWFVDPDGRHVFSLGLNHVDPASLRYPENAGIGSAKYSNSMRRWLQTSVRPNLVHWGFNCIGWTQEVVSRGPTNHRHSRPFTAEEYGWLNYPYCHMLPFAEIHQWNAEPRNTDFFSNEFADWCDHVAREHCVPLAQDPRLIGYFYADCPTWAHTRQWNAWRGPIFDPERLSSEAGRKALFELASQYYRVTHAAVRRYDANHLILGDRYEAMARLPNEGLAAARPYVDVLSFQHFGSSRQIAEDLQRWHSLAGLPVLVAESTRNLPQQGGAIAHDTMHYAEWLRALRNVEGAVGFHLCGAYIQNRIRRRGLLDEREKFNPAAADIRRANLEMTDWQRQTLRARTFVS